MACVTTYEYEPLEGERFTRLLKIRGFNASPSPTREHVSAVVSAKNSAWCSRGWIIQGFLLSRAFEFLWGGRAISEMDFYTLRCACSLDLASTHGLRGSANLVMLHFTRGELAKNQDLECSHLLYVISGLSGYFATTIEHDGLFAYLGLWESPSFLPSYNKPLKNVFIKFAHSLAKDTGSLDFLPIRKFCRSNRPGLASLPSWVPIWSEARLSLPTDMIFPSNLEGTETPWNAAAGLCHESSVRGASDSLSVKGRVIDHISFTSQFVMSWKHFPDHRGLYSELEKLTREIATWREAQSWKMVDTLELLLRLSKRSEDYERSAGQTLNDLEEGRASALRIVSETMGKLSERKFMMARGDRLGLVASYCMEGHSIAIIHGCRVPLILSENVEDGMYEVMGDCYLEGVMFGEAVTWKKEDADELILS